jgi:hypothetical protein
MESSTELSWEDLCEREEHYNREISRNIKPCQVSSSKELEQSPLNTKLTIPTPTPHSAAPPSPPLPTAGMDLNSSIGQVEHVKVAMDGPSLAARPGSGPLGLVLSFDEALSQFPRSKVYRDPSRLDSDRERWASLCKMYGPQRVTEIFAGYVKRSDASCVDDLFKRFFGYLTENLHLKRVDQPAPSENYTSPGR